MEGALQTCVSAVAWPGNPMRLNHHICVWLSLRYFLFKLRLNSLHLSLGAGQFLSEVERHEDAADHYVKAAQLAPSEYEIIFNAANTLRQAGRNKQAEEYYRLAVNLRPQVGVTTVLNMSG